MPAPAGFSDTSLTDKRFLKTGALTIPGGGALMAGGEASALTRTHEHPPGTVLVYKTADENFVLADNAAGDRNSQASVTSTIDITDPKNLTFKWKYKSGAEQTFTAGGGDDDVDKLITAMNTDDNFQANLVASKTGSKLVIKTKAAGKGEYFEVTDGTLNDLGGAEATFADDTSHKGADADYRVTRGTAWLKDADGSAQDYFVDTVLAGDFDTSELSSLTAEAQVVLERRGSRFD